MGSLFIVVWGLILSPIALLMGVVLSYFIPYLCGRFRHTPTDNRQIGCLTRGAWALFFAVILEFVACASYLLVSFPQSNDYWNYAGVGDYWRMPLEPPYELTMLNSLDEASISEWKSKGWIFAGIKQYEKRGNLIAGRYTNPFNQPEESGYFVFDCGTGDLKKFDQEDLFRKACAEKGFATPLTLKLVNDNWNLYWSDPKRRKK